MGKQPRKASDAVRRLRERREERGLSRNMLARELTRLGFSVTERQIYRWEEKGVQPHPNNVRGIEQWLEGRGGSQSWAEGPRSVLSEIEEIVREHFARTKGHEEYWRALRDEFRVRAEVAERRLGR